MKAAIATSLATLALTLTLALTALAAPPGGCPPKDANTNNDQNQSAHRSTVAASKACGPN